MKEKTTNIKNHQSVTNNHTYMHVYVYIFVSKDISRSHCILFRDSITDKHLYIFFILIQ